MEDEAFWMVLTVGSINMDICMKVPRIPAPGETVLSTGVISSPGGKGANQAVACAKLGGDVHMIGRVGNDAYGQALLESLIAGGVHTEAVAFDGDAASGTAFICVSDKGENAIVVNPGANSRVSPAQLEDNLGLFEAARYCVVQMEIPRETVFRTIEICHEKNVKIILNPSPVQELPDEVLRGVDFLVPNENEAEFLIGKSMKGISDEDLRAYVSGKGIKNLLLTLGKNGCVRANARDVRRFPATKDKPLDTTGAGDCFLGAFACGVSEGMEIDMAVELAIKAAGITVTRFGAQRAMPGRGEISL